MIAHCPHCHSKLTTFANDPKHLICPNTLNCYTDDYNVTFNIVIINNQIVHLFTYVKLDQLYSVVVNSTFVSIGQLNPYQQIVSMPGCSIPPDFHQFTFNLVQRALKLKAFS